MSKEQGPAAQTSAAQTSAAMRVLVTCDAVGGVWQYTLDLARGLAALGIETFAAVLGPGPDAMQAAAAARIEGLTLIETGLPLDWLAEEEAMVRKAGESIAALAAFHSVDLVQLHAPALAAHTRFPVPVLAVNHSCLTTWWAAVQGGAPEGDFAWRARLTGRGLAAADLAVAPTAAFAEATRRAYRLHVRPAAVHNGRSPLPLARRERSDFAFTAGRLWDKGKNAATLDRAAARLAVPIHAAGPLAGPAGDVIAFDHVRPLGTLDEATLGHWLGAAPVFVSAALYEPFGLAVAEAAKAGCPLVLSDIATFRELWDGAAVFVDPRDDTGFAAAIERILADGDLRSRLGAAARERAARYTPGAMARNMAAHYRRLAGARRSLREREAA